MQEWEDKPKHKHVKKIILFGFILAVYIISSSAVYNVNKEKKVVDFLVDSTLQILRIKNNHNRDVVRREKELTNSVEDVELAERLKGKILLQIEANGAAWYLDPVDLKRYYFGRPADMMLIIKKLSKKMPIDDIVDYIYFEKKFPEELAGRFIANQDKENEYYYIIPESRLAIPLKTSNEAFRLLKDLGLGITNENIRKIKVGELWM
jgi:hypothetical protein